jgi:primosomal protein N' (replication factor Y)
LGQAFTYRLPEGMQAGKGSRVICEFGRRRILGVVIEETDTPPKDFDEAKIKPVLAVVGEHPPLPTELLDFLLALARYYLAPIGEVLRMALPALERSEVEELQQQLLGNLKLQTVGRLVQQASALVATMPVPPPRGQAAEILAHLIDAGPSPLATLEEQWGNARAACRKLVEAGLVALERIEVSRDPFANLTIVRDQPPELTDAQHQAVEAIKAAVTSATPEAFLLQGVTASGKTEVYLHAVEHVLKLGGSAVILVPEIALTPQLVGRFRARLGEGIAVLHSGLSDGDRHAMWQQLRSGKLRVAIGARSALFAPVANLRLLCIDEEHDPSFKQEEGVRYHARDMALLRAHRAGAVAVLGSATPSVNSEALVRDGRLTRLRLPARARSTATLPTVEVVDLRRIGPGPTGDRLLSIRMFRALEETLARGEQSILFLNRRGFAPAMECDDCGHILQCPLCSVALTLHRRGGEQMVCHYCDHHKPVPPHCPACGGPRLGHEGVGTERIEAALAEVLPSARIARLDRDIAAGAASEAILERVRRGEVDILVGTQMVTKGHDLPNVTLVGVLNADAALSLPDFRAAERTFHLLVQVAGRAGRGERPGRVLIQTRQPEHPAVELATRHDVDSFLSRELEARAELGYPPYGRLALVRVDATDETRAREASESLAAVARRVAAAGVNVIGPAEAPLKRLKGRFRFRFMVRADDHVTLRAPLLAVLRTAMPSTVRVSVDIDPMHML